MSITGTNRATLTLAAFLVFAALGSLGCGAEEEAAAPPEEPQARPVKYVEVVSLGGERTRTFTGIAKADTRSEFGFRVSGQVARVLVEQGNLLAKGALIAELDPVDFEIQAREIEAALAEAKANEVLAAADFQRIQRLYEKDNASQGDFDAALAKRDAARAGVESVEQKLDQAGRQTEFTQLRAPIDCAVVEVLAEEGESIQAGSAVVEVITGANPQVQIAVPETAISEISEGRSAKIRFSAVPGRTFYGKVATVGVVPAEGVTTYPVTIELNQSWNQLTGRTGAPPLRPGMAVEAEMSFGREGGAAQIVPPGAVVADRQGKYVFVVETAGSGLRATRRSVETGRLVTEGLQVLSGLSTGDKVITAGLNQVKDGQPVRLLDAE